MLHECEVVFVLPHLGPGGAQRVVSLVANYWAAQGLNIAIITLLDDKDDAHRLDRRVKRVRLAQVFAADEAYIRRAHRSVLTTLRRIITGESARRGFRRLARRVAFKIAEILFGTLVWPAQSGETFRVRKRDFLALWVARALAGQQERRLRLVLEASRPPRVISFLTKTNIYTALATWHLPVHVVVSERNDPDLQYLDSVWNKMRTFSYQRAAVLTSNSDGVLKKMQRFCDESRLQLLPNPLVLPRVASDGTVQERRFIIVARLVEQKAIDVLLDAFAKISDEVPNWQLDIVGDGPLQDKLTLLARQLGIAERVTFHGHVTNPLDYLRRARVFVLPSRFEGMPNSLLEAMACGLPAVVSDASPGPLEIVRHEATGLVVPVEDAGALAASMLRLARDEAYRAELGAAARSVVSKHSWAEVERTWREVLRLSDVTGDREQQISGLDPGDVRAPGAAD